MLLGGPSPAKQIRAAGERLRKSLSTIQITKPPSGCPWRASQNPGQAQLTKSHAFPGWPEALRSARRRRHAAANTLHCAGEQPQRAYSQLAAVISARSTTRWL